VARTLAELVEVHIEPAVVFIAVSRMRHQVAPAMAWVEYDAITMQRMRSEKYGDSEPS
jgi:hypothetical protein